MSLPARARVASLLAGLALLALSAGTAEAQEWKIYIVGKTEPMGRFRR